MGARHNIIMYVWISNTLFRSAFAVVFFHLGIFFALIDDFRIAPAA